MAANHPAGLPDRWSAPTGPPPATDDSPRAAIMRLVDGYWPSQAVHAAAQLGLADHLATGPQDGAALAAATGAHGPSLQRLLRALATLGVVAEGADGRFALTPLGDCLRGDRADSLRAIVLFRCGLEYPTWGNLTQSVRTGAPAFGRVFGTSLWNYLAAHPDANVLTNEAMAGFSAAAAAAVPQAYDFGGLGTIVDVGGGNGALLAAILRAYPQARGILFDQPHVVAGAADLLAAQGVAGRCTVVGGDFFAASLPGGDAYLLKWILHDWGDEAAVRILQTCRRAMRERGRLLILELVLPAGAIPGAKYQQAAFADLTMLVMTQGGRERSEADWAALLAAAGFRHLHTIPTAANLSIVEALPV